MSITDRIAGFFSSVEAKIKRLAARIRKGVNEADQIADVCARAVLRLGDKMAAYEPSDLPWLYGTLANAVVKGQYDGLILSLAGPEKFAALKLAVTGAQEGVRALDERIDTRWAKSRPFVEAFIDEAKDLKVLGFERKAA